MADIHSFEPFWGTWRIVKPLGQGSYGKVYLVQREDFGDVYYAAMKHLSIPADRQQTDELYAEGMVSDDATAWDYYKQMLNTLVNEIKVNYKLKGHTNIVSYEEHMILEKPDMPGYDVFIRMELLTSLTDYIRQQPLTVDAVARLGEDICSALLVLKRERIVHRDIKPANIFVNSGGDFKLGDFGVARTMDKTVSSMSVKGTFTYMAPEVAKGEDGSFGVDIYSLGLVMYKLLNGNRSPFLPPLPAQVTHSDTQEAQRRRFQGDPLPPPAYAPPELASIILKACAYRSEDRYESPEAMQKALADCRRRMSPSVGGQVVLSMIRDDSKSTYKSTLRPPDLPVYTAPEPSIPPAPVPEPEPEDDATVILDPSELPPQAPSVSYSARPRPAPAPVRTPVPPPAPAPAAARGGPPVIPIIAGVGAVVLGAVLFLALRGGGKPAETAPPTPSQQAETALPTAAPTPTPVPASTPEPSASPTPSAQPTNTPESTAEPTAEPSAKPTAAAKPSASPSQKPSPTPKASKKPKSSAKPSAKPTAAPASEPTPPPQAPSANIPVSGISLSTGSATLDVGSSLRLSATVTPADATNPQVSWSSSNSAVASVDGSGNVSTRGTGKAVITATCGGHSASCTLIVN